jgi:5'-3' exonuclease
MRGNSIDDGNTFSSVMITPGTAWMNQLDEWMKTIGVKRLVVKQDTCVVFSSCFIPGEGEHKLLEYIRERAPVDDYFRLHQTHCHFGPDGDLIMLALATQVQYVYLLRDGREIGTYDFLDVSSIRSDLVNVLYATKIANTKSVCNRSPTDAANDFIFAGFFVGNDFLPKVNMFFFLEDGLEMMIRIIDALAFHGMYITQNGAITRNIQKFVEAIAQSEYTYISDQQFQQVPETEDDRFVNWTLVDSLNKKGTLDFQMYRDLYYKKAFNVDVVTPQYISEMCEKFWRMLVWVFVYYTQGIEHSGWEEIYPYHYAPMMTDLAKYLKSIHDSKFFCTFNRGRPSTHIEQLCSVLPPSASHLVPKKFSSILSGNLDFSIDYEGKTKEYQGIALIDFVDITTIRKKVAKIGNSQSPDQLRFFAHK